MTRNTLITIITIMSILVLAPALAFTAEANQWTIVYLEPSNVTSDSREGHLLNCYTTNTTIKKYYNLYIKPPDKGYLLLGINNPNPKYKITFGPYVGWVNGRFAGDGDVFVALSSNTSSLIYNATVVLKHFMQNTHCVGPVGHDWYRNEILETVSVSFNVDGFRDYEIACVYKYYEFVDPDHGVNRTKVDGEPCGNVELAIAWDNPSYGLEDILVQPPEGGGNDSGVSGIVTQDEPPVDRLPGNTLAGARQGLAAMAALGLLAVLGVFVFMASRG